MMSDTVLVISVGICLFSVVLLEQSTPKVYWNILHQPISFGEDVQLSCNITCCIKNNKESASWVIKDLKSISENLISTDDKKYTIMTTKHACRLEIKNFRPEDANKVYTCYYNFQHYSRNLTLDEHSFEKQPDKGDISVQEINIDGRYTIHAHIINVFPDPKCEAYLDQKNLTSKLTISLNKTGILTNISIGFSFVTTDGIFKLICRIGNRSHKLKETAFITTNTENTFIGIVIVTVICFIQFIALIKTCFLLHNKRQHVQRVPERPEDKPLLKEDMQKDIKEMIEVRKSKKRIRYYSIP